MPLSSCFLRVHSSGIEVISAGIWRFLKNRSAGIFEKGQNALVDRTLFHPFRGDFGGRKCVDRRSRWRSDFVVDLRTQKYLLTP